MSSREEILASIRKHTQSHYEKPDIADMKRLTYPDKVEQFCAISRAVGGTVSVWKKKYEAKQDVVPEQNIIDKICAFFGCSESWLRGIEKAPTQDGERKIDDRKIKAAFLGGLADGLSDAEINEYWDDARDYIGFKIQQKKNKSD